MSAAAEDLTTDGAEIDVIVIGAGIMGAATARALALAGKRVLVLEQYQIGHRDGSSHGASRAFTFAHPDPEFVAMAAESQPLWRSLEAETGARLLTPIGALLRPLDLSSITATLDQHLLDYEVLTAAAIDARFGIRLPRAASLIYQADAGMLAADVALHAMLSSAQKHGAELHERTRVTGFTSDSQGVEVRTTGQTLRARAAVVTAGGWAPALLAEAGVALTATPTRETVAFYEMDENVPALFEHGNPPLYSLLSPGEGLKVGEHHAGPVADPPHQGAPSDDSIARLTQYVRSRFPMARPEPSHAETCIYTNTPDERFVLECHGRIVVGCACNGQGFKFAPAIGNRLAAMAVESAK